VPNPKCDVQQADLADLRKPCQLQTSESMRAVYERAKKAKSIAAREKILAQHGLHFVDVRAPWAHVLVTISQRILRTSSGACVFRIHIKVIFTTSCIAATWGLSAPIFGLSRSRYSSDWAHWESSLHGLFFSTSSCLL
jgi:hypothetical protein